MSEMPLVLAEELAGEFPDSLDRLLELECEDQSFIALAEAYDAVASEIQDIETGIDPACPAYCAQLRRRYARLREELFARLNA